MFRHLNGHFPVLPFLFTLLLYSCTPVISLFPDYDVLDTTWTDSGDATYTVSDEKRALVDLWRSAGGIHWSTTWDLRQDPCVNGWVGIICNQYGSVISIDLPRNRLSGYLPRSLGVLTSLKKLHLNDNMLTGPLPKSFQHLVNLESINLSQNYFTGPMPMSVAGFAKVVLFHIASNDFNEKTMPDEYLKMEKRGVDCWIFSNK
jgi:hypothetical protein